MYDLFRRCHQHFGHGQPLDLEAEDPVRRTTRFLRRIGQLDAAGLAAAAGVDLGLDHDATAQTRRDILRLLRGRRHRPRRDRDAMLAEYLLGLILVDVHRVTRG